MWNVQHPKRRILCLSRRDLVGNINAKIDKRKVTVEVLKKGPSSVNFEFEDLLCGSGFDVRTDAGVLSR